MKCFFVSLGALFEKHGAAQTDILTNKSHYKETRSFEYLNFPASSKMAAFSCRILGYFRERFRRDLALVGS